MSGTFGVPGRGFETSFARGFQGNIQIRTKFITLLLSVLINGFRSHEIKTILWRQSNVGVELGPELIHGILSPRGDDRLHHERSDDAGEHPDGLVTILVDLHRIMPNW